MENRVARQPVERTTPANMQTNLSRTNVSRMPNLGPRTSSGKSIAKPSDDAGGASGATAYLADQASAKPDSRNPADGPASLGNSESTMPSATTALRRARDLAVLGANSGAMCPTARKAIATEIDGLLSHVADVGIRHKQVSETQSSIAAKLQDTASQPSGIGDTDLEETILDLKMQEVTYRGALGAASRVLQPTLMDYLR